PGDTDNRRVLALLHAQLGEPAEAQKIMDELIEAQGLNRANAGGAAAAKARTGDLEAAVAILDQYVKSRGDQAEVDDYLLLGRFFMGWGMADKALASYRLAIEREDPNTKPATRELADM